MMNFLFQENNYTAADYLAQKVVLCSLCSITGIYIYACFKHLKSVIQIVTAFFAVFALGHLCFITFLWTNHISFPLNLEAMELLRLQHIQRILAGLPLYPAPSPDFIALAYNPLSYYFTIPFTWVFGANLWTMRLVAILGTIGCGLIIFATVRRQSQSTWWGLMAVGLFAAAYRVMDTYLDNAHADSWLLCTILLGCYVLDRYRAIGWNCVGILLFITAFWFKQQGYLFAIAALLWLTWREGRRAWRYWLLAMIVGPGLYLTMPDWVLGSHFHYYTWQVPRQWVELTKSGLLHFLKYTIGNYPILLISSSLLVAPMFPLRQFWRRQFWSNHQPAIWYWMFPFALLSGLIAELTTGSNNNVLIPMGTWLILVGVLGFQRWANQAFGQRWGGHLLALSFSFAIFAYHPQSVIVSSQAPSTYQDLLGYIRSLPGQVAAPGIGQMPEGRPLFPSLHWVTFQDVLRGPGAPVNASELAQRLLKPALEPKQPAYILNNSRLEDDPFFAPLWSKYRVERDLGDRFQALTTLPKRYLGNYPRYLYRFMGKNADERR
jgi:hypothetical protein